MVVVVEASSRSPINPRRNDPPFKAKASTAALFFPPNCWNFGLPTARCTRQSPQSENAIQPRCPKCERTCVKLKEPKYGANYQKIDHSHDPALHFFKTIVNQGFNLRLIAEKEPKRKQRRAKRKGTDDQDADSE